MTVNIEAQQSVYSLLCIHTQVHKLPGRYLISHINSITHIIWRELDLRQQRIFHKLWSCLVSILICFCCLLDGV
jgi:hypothetical protein